MWSDDWIGLAYRELGRGPDTYDCLGLFLALQKARLGRKLPDPLCPMSAARGAAFLAPYRSGWDRVELAALGDALLFRAGRSWHIGFALDARMMLHIEDERGSRIEPFGSSLFGARLEGIYRFAG